MFSRSRFAVLLVCSACHAAAEPNEQLPRSVTTSAATMPTASAEPVKKVELRIASVGDDAMYDKETMTVPARSVVHLTLTNAGETAAVPRNWVLTWEGANVAQFVADCREAGPDAGYISTRPGAVIASTPVVPPGESVDVTFVAPEYPGNYPYVCTVPGRSPEMKGVLTVTP